MRQRGSLLVVALVLAVALATSGAHAQAAATVRVDASRPVNIVDPRTALGAGVDGHGRGVVAKIYTPANVRAMRAAGFGRLTYRLRTELGIEAWHWNPRGRWSDSAHRQGYWVSDSTSATPITLSHGYRLPRRGNSIDQAENDGYSRLDDGDTTTFWKSNPYLDHRFTGEPDARHPQTVIVDLGHLAPVDAIRIAWGVPWATSFRVQYWSGTEVNDVDENPAGRWRTFTNGEASGASGGTELRRLEPSSIEARFIRIAMTESSGAGAPFTRDPRDSAGYAIRELWIGTLAPDDHLVDIVRHGTSRTTQSLTYASSTDPWHRASDLDPDVEQPGLDLVYRERLTSEHDAMLAVPVLFDTPENAHALMAFLRGRAYPIVRLELGEEPDGQYTPPEDFAELWARTASALRSVNRRVPLGGPSFQGLESRVMMAWPNDTAGAPWMTRFLGELRAHDALSAYQFVSFEWYPFDDICAPSAPQLIEAPERLEAGLSRLRAEGVPDSVPRIIAEYGWSAFAGQAQVDIDGALLDADIVGRFLTSGGRAAYLYGFEPTTLDHESWCPDSWGNNAIFLSDDERRIRYRLATYWSEWMMLHDWMSAAGGEHAIYAASIDAAPGTDSTLTAYALRRPSGEWSLMFINKSPDSALTVTVRIEDPAGEHALGPRARLVQFSHEQYQWQAAGEAGHPSRSLPPARSTVDGSRSIVLPTYSITVLRGPLAAP